MKFFTSEDDARKIQEQRHKQFNEHPDRELHFHIGYFTNAYAIVEMRVTLFLAKATGITQLQGFDLLTRGMDLRVKIERLRRACESKFPLGPNLSARLTVLDEQIRPLRNKIAHTFLAPSPDKETISFTTLAAMPRTTVPRHPDSVDPETIKLIDLFEAAGWLKALNRDLTQAYQDAALTGTLEIIHPLSPLPQGSNPPRGQPKPYAKPSRRERKRIRKGQEPRAKK